MGIGVYSRRELKKHFRAWLRANITSVGVIAAGAVVAGVLQTWAMTASDMPPAVAWYLLGLCHMFLLGGLPTILFVAFLASDPDAIRHLRGAWGEENTQDLLRRARRRRIIWGWVDSIPLSQGDIDHLVVTRRGGLIAIDSKWRNTFNLADRDAMARSAERARVRASAIVDSVVRSRGRGQRASGPGVRVRPVVVVWGALQSEIPDSAKAHGVDFVAGSTLTTWLKRLDGDPIDRDAAQELVGRVKAFKETSSKANLRAQR